MEREARVAEEPALDRGRLVRRGVVEHQVDVEMRRHRGVDQVEEATELLSAMPWRRLRDHLPRGDIKRRVQVGRPVADVVVAAPLRHTPGISGSTGAERSSAWICAFSSTQSTTAASGGFRYRPTMSRTLSMSCGSGESLNASVWCGLSPNARQSG